MQLHLKRETKMLTQSSVQCREGHHAASFLWVAGVSNGITRLCICFSNLSHTTPFFTISPFSTDARGMKRKHFFCWVHIKVFTVGEWIYLGVQAEYKYKIEYKHDTNIDNEFYLSPLINISNFQLILNRIKFSKLNLVQNDCVPFLVYCWEINNDMESIFAFRKQFVQRLWDA